MGLTLLRPQITSSAAITLSADELDATDLVRIVTTSPQLTMTTFGQLALFIQGEVVGLYNDGGVLGLSNPFGWPTAPSGLPGSLWSNGGAVSAVLGSTPNPSATPVFFGAITSSKLLALTGVNLPLSDPRVINQLWNNVGLVCISFG